MPKAILNSDAAHFLFQFISIFEPKPNAILIFCETCKEIFRETRDLAVIQDALLDPPQDSGDFVFHIEYIEQQK